jgi:hypothetical protein
LEFVLLNLQVLLRCETGSRSDHQGSSDYYSSGILPECVKSIAERPEAVIAETMTASALPEGDNMTTAKAKLMYESNGWTSWSLWAALLFVLTLAGWTFYLTQADLPVFSNPR